jgi:hypothetical protein
MSGTWCSMSLSVAHLLIGKRPGQGAVWGARGIKLGTPLVAPVHVHVQRTASCLTHRVYP